MTRVGNLKAVLMYYYIDIDIDYNYYMAPQIEPLNWRENLS